MTIEQPDGLYVPGSVIKTLLGDKTSPVLYGYDQNALGVLFKSGPSSDRRPAVQRRRRRRSRRTRRRDAGRADRCSR